MSRNESLGIVQVHHTEVDELNDALRELVRRMDEMKGLSGQVTIHDDLLVDGALSVGGDVVMATLGPLEPVTLTPVPDPATGAPLFAEDLRNDLVANVLPAIRANQEALRDLLNALLGALS